MLPLGSGRGGPGGGVGGDGAPGVHTAPAWEGPAILLALPSGGGSPVTRAALNCAGPLGLGSCGKEKPLGSAQGASLYDSYQGDRYIPMLAPPLVCK